MEFTDSHSHLYLDAFSEDRDEVVQRALESGVTRMYLPNIDSTTIGPMEALCEAFPGNCFPMMGLHPTSVKENFMEEIETAGKKLATGSYAAIGETGIDLYWDKTFLEEQKEAFRIQVRWAKAYGLPIVIHARDSFDAIFEVLDEEHEDGLKGVFHSFTGTAMQAEKALSYGFLLGINGIVTFKNSGLDRVIREISTARLMIETDAPFLAPVPFRGKRNESVHVIKVAEKIAELHNLSVDEVAAVTTRNALELFKLS